MGNDKPASAPPADALQEWRRETAQELTGLIGTIERRIEALAASAQVREAEAVPIEHPMSFESQAARILGHGTAPKHIRRTLASYTPKPRERK